MGTRITEGHDFGTCIETNEKRKAAFRRLRGLLNELNMCDVEASEAADLPKDRRFFGVPLITYPDRIPVETFFELQPYELKERREERPPGCTCNKRNGLQDRCRVCASRQPMDGSRSGGGTRPGSCRPDQLCQPRCAICKGPVSPGMFQHPVCPPPSPGQPQPAPEHCKGFFLCPVTTQN